LKEWQEYFYEYACRYFDFPISKVKCDALAQNSYEYWEDQKWLRDKKIMVSWKRTIETKVRSSNTRLKDWDVINNQSEEQTIPEY